MRSLQQLTLAVMATLTLTNTVASADYAPSATSYGVIANVLQSSGELNGEKGDANLVLVRTSEVNSVCPGAKGHFIIKGSDPKHAAMLSLATAAVLSGQRVRLAFLLDAQDRLCYVYSIIISKS